MGLEIFGGGSANFSAAPCISLRSKNLRRILDFYWVVSNFPKIQGVAPKLNPPVVVEGGSILVPHPVWHKTNSLPLGIILCIAVCDEGGICWKLTEFLLHKKCIIFLIWANQKYSWLGWFLSSFDRLYVDFVRILNKSK